jgi:hypothetical protein
MRHLQASEREFAQINTLVATLSRSVELLNFDIDYEEECARVNESSDPADPMLARHLRARRDNLIGTLNALRARLPEQTNLERSAAQERPCSDTGRTRRQRPYR